MAATVGFERPLDTWLLTGLDAISPPTPAEAPPVLALGQRLCMTGKGRGKRNSIQIWVVKTHQEPMTLP